MVKDSVPHSKRSISGVAAGIVTYNPSIDRLNENISSVYNQVDYIYVFDNGSENLNDIEELVNNYEEIQINKSSSNMGIAYALNRLFEQADNDGFHWLLTLDQDSICFPNLVTEYCKYINDADSLCSLRVDRNINRNEMKDFKFRVVQRCITSGNMVRVRAWKNILGFNERLFIDMVDYDFCYRLQRAGYKILQIGFIGVLHELGDGEHEKVLGKRIYTGSYSPMRKYYITRNTIYIYMKYRPNNKKYSIKWLIAMIIHTLTKEDDKLQKLKAITMGVIDGFKKYSYIDQYFDNLMGGVLLSRIICINNYLPGGVAA